MFTDSGRSTLDTSAFSLLIMQLFWTFHIILAELLDVLYFTTFSFEDRGEYHVKRQRPLDSLMVFSTFSPFLPRHRHQPRTVSSLPEKSRPLLLPALSNPSFGS